MTRDHNSLVTAHRTRRHVGVVAVLIACLVTVGSVAPAAAAPTAERPALGTPPPTGFGSPGTPVRPASERYVREAYQAVLDRDADEAGLAYWGGRLDADTSRYTFAQQMVLSQESLDAHITTIYDAFGRSPTAAERSDARARLLARAATPESLMVDLFSSTEYINRHGAAPDAVVRALYQDLLGRAGSDAEVGYWTDVIASGSDPQAVLRVVVTGFVYSPERLRSVVIDAYDRLLARTSDDPGRAYWVGRIRRSGTILAVDRSLVTSDEAWGRGCSILDSARCMLPFPNDRLTLPDPSTDTGRRVVLKPPWVPAPTGGPAFDPTEWNRQDGFSPGSAIIVSSNGIDPEQSGLPPLTDIGSSLDPGSPIVLVDTATGERIPLWAELDANATTDAERVLYIRPARNMRDGHTYAVGIGQMRDAAGSVLTAPGGFRACLDEGPNPSRRVREQCEAAQDAADEVVAAGLDRADLYLAWTFTVASTRNLAERAVHMRNETLGGAAGTTAAPFTVTSSEPRDDGTTRIDGTFQVPNYLTGTGAPGSRLKLGPDDLPEASGPLYTAPFTCTIPDSATESPVRPSLYGHGLLGTGGQANSSYIRSFSVAHDLAFCGTDYIGMSESDLPNTASLLGDLSRFPELVDRNQQGLLNQLVLGRLMTLPDGFVSDAAFQNGSGDPLIEAPGGELFYYGNSQGAIMGGALVALSTDIERGVLGVPGMNYSTLLDRSVDFDPFFALLAAAYPSAMDRSIMVSTIQMLWDRGEANGYANHMTTDPLPGTPTHEVLLHVALGDHQVATITADVMARTYGAATNDPPVAPGRSTDVAPLWGIDRIPSYPYAGSALIYWDSGTPLPPVENVPNRAGEDPHGDPRSDPEAQLQMSDFLQPGGTVTDVCPSGPCTAEPT